MTTPEAKICATCGRRFEWRAKWADDWETVRYCSRRCRNEKPGALDAALETAIAELLDARDPGKTICPSEAARRVAADRDGDWRALLERTRRAARRLVHRGELEITQGGRVVDPTDARGALRLRRPRS